MDGAELKVEGVSYSYGRDDFSLKNISLSLKGGEILALLGPNGSGKTTLTKIVLGILKPHPPSVTVGGVNLFEVTEKERAKLIAWVPQEIMKNVPLRVEDFVLLGRTPHISPLSIPSDLDRKLVAEALRKFGLEILAKRYFSQLSGGERRLASIARAYVQGTPFMVLDEPTAYLDFKNKLLALKVMKELAQEGRGILFTTHDPNEAVEIADQVVLMYRGEILISGNPDEVINEEILEKVYGIKVKIVRSNGKAYVTPSIGQHIEA